MRLLGLLALSLTGCTLIDQNTFNPRAGDAPVIPRPAPVAAAPVIPGPPPLVVIGAAGPQAQSEALRQAVAAARARKPDVVFDVIEVQAPDAPGTEAIGANARAVGRIVVAEGIRPDRVRLVVRPETGGAAGTVRVYVR